MTPDVNVVISHSEYTVLVVDDVVSNGMFCHRKPCCCHNER